ncbi:MAG: GGDEF domain-containing response regulator [Bacillota bacterium]
MKKNQADRILLIDQDKLLTDELAGRLNNVGFDVLSANDEETALKLIEVSKPTIILLDILMKGKDGRDILTTLKSMNISSNIPIIVLTSDSDVNSKVYGFLQGASDYITKPVFFPEILARINNLIRLLNMQKELEEKNKELMEKNTLLEQMAITDSLTGLFNKGYVLERLESEIQRAARYNEAISLIIIDIDHFKEVNDTYGHLMGDKLIKEISEEITSSVRDVDIVGRYGGDELMVICPNTDINGAKILAERIRSNIHNHKFELKGEIVPITVSLGVSSAAPSLYTKADSDIVRIIGEADIALYRAKSSSRNKVEAYENNTAASSLTAKEKLDSMIMETSQTLDKYTH